MSQRKKKQSNETLKVNGYSVKKGGFPGAPWTAERHGVPLGHYKSEAEAWRVASAHADHYKTIKR